jgi:hypothetical protein
MNSFFIDFKFGLEKRLSDFWRLSALIQKISGLALSQLNRFLIHSGRTPLCLVCGLKGSKGSKGVLNAQWIESFDWTRSRLEKVKPTAKMGLLPFLPSSNWRAITKTAIIYFVSRKSRKSLLQQESKEKYAWRKYVQRI